MQQICVGFQQLFKVLHELVVPVLRGPEVLVLLCHALLVELSQVFYLSWFSNYGWFALENVVVRQVNLKELVVSLEGLQEFLDLAWIRA